MFYHSTNFRKYKMKQKPGCFLAKRVCIVFCALKHVRCIRIQGRCWPEEGFVSVYGKGQISAVVGCSGEERGRNTVLWNGSGDVRTPPPSTLLLTWSWWNISASNSHNTLELHQLQQTLLLYLFLLQASKLTKTGLFNSRISYVNMCFWYRHHVIYLKTPTSFYQISTRNSRH